MFANGGGVGDPLRRSRNKVLEDVKNGYVTAEQARTIYGLDVQANIVHGSDSTYSAEREIKLFFPDLA